MKEDLKDWLEIVKVVSPIIVAFFSAYYGTVRALNKFKKEKVWDERKSAENEVVSACEELHHWAEKVRAETCCEPASSIVANDEEAFRTISKYAKKGKLIFSDEFYNIVEKLNTELEITKFKFNEDSYCETPQEQSNWCFNMAVAIQKLINEYLPKLIETAKKKRYK